jgi:hypothetical protein
MVEKESHILDVLMKGAGFMLVLWCWLRSVFSGKPRPAQGGAKPAKRQRTYPVGPTATAECECGPGPHVCSRAMTCLFVCLILL